MTWLGFDFEPVPDAGKFLRGFFTPPSNAVVDDAPYLATSPYHDPRVTHLLKKVDVPFLEEILGYTFKEKSFLLEALSHCSFTVNRVTNSYERLEFLGML